MTGNASPSWDSRPLDVAIATACEAGALVRNMRAIGVSTRAKDDASPVTEADEAADALIRSRLTAAFPGDGWISEESVAAAGDTATSASWVVDPIDGTESYVDGGVRGYAVQIARVVGGEVVLGVVYEPRERLLMFAARGRGAFTQADGGPPIAIVPAPHAAGAPPRFVASARTEAATLDALTGSGLAQAGLFRSVGVKVGMLVREEAEVYPATHRVALWDIAAPMVILEEAGGCMTDRAGQRLRLPLAPPYVLERDFVATRGGAELHARVCAILGTLGPSGSTT
jgi:3'-phosphoadenosine 5'-phosphosulfate (PAPS) 3'-phosphatase